MKHFSFSDLNRATGKILDEALKGPITLTKHGRNKLVLMPVEVFERLTEWHRPKAYSMDDLPAQVALELEEALQQTLDELSEGDGR